MERRTYLANNPDQSAIGAIRAPVTVLGIDPVGNKPDEYAAQLKADLDAWGPVVKKANLRIE